MAETWTHERVLALVAGRNVCCSDSNADRIDVPPWLFASGATEARLSLGQRVAVTHAEDRQTVIDSWLQAIHRPGEIIETEVRVKLDGSWVPTTTRRVNLLGDPAFGVVVEAIEFGRPVTSTDFEETLQEGEFEETRWFMHTLDESATILATEGMVEEILGRHPTDVVGQAVVDHLHPDGLHDALRQWMEVLNGLPGTTRTGRQRIVRPDGSVVWTECIIIRRDDVDGQMRATAIVYDASDRQRQVSALKASQLEFQLLADQVPAAVFRTDADQRITFRNERWRTEIDGGAPVDRLADIVHPDDRSAHEGRLTQLASGRSDTTAVYEVRSADGERVLAISCRSVLDLVNENRSYIGSVTDVTATVRLRERAERDALTGLRNRHATEEHLAAAVAEMPEATAVVFVDLDGFKTVNDTWGHDAGDHVLRVLAERLSTTMRPEDVVGRFGGDEFVIVASPVGAEADAGLLARIDGALAEPIAWPGGSWSPAASIGIAHGRPGDDAASLITRADHEMFADKRQRKALI